MRLHRMIGMAGLTSATLLVAMTAPALADPPTDDSTPRTVDTRFSAQEIRIMAETSGRSESDQRQHLERQERKNNTYAELAADGHDYDGAYFTADDQLVVLAPTGSAAADAATDAGLKVVAPERGQAALEQLTATISDLAAGADGRAAGIATIAPDITTDRVVVTVAGDTAPAQKLLATYGDAVEIRQGAANSVQSTVLGGDEVTMGGFLCSAGFPAKNASGTRYMVWVGHCLEGTTTVSKGGTRIGTTAGTAFTSYDGKPDRDIGYVKMDAEDTMSADVNDYGTTSALDASRGVWRAPVGTDVCKSGRTTGITCGKVTGYGASVTYSDESGQPVAQVSGLGTSTVCTEGGDSGGAYVSGGYAVGMTSGGPANQRCGGFNSGTVSGASSYFQPVDDALRYYGLTYGA